MNGRRNVDQRTACFRLSEKNKSLFKKKKLLTIGESSYDIFCVIALGHSDTRCKKERKKEGRPPH
jgi:hypothetical protein